MRRIIATKHRPDHWPVPDENEGPQEWEDAWGKHLFDRKKNVLTTEYSDPQPAQMQLKRKYGGR